MFYTTIFEDGSVVRTRAKLVFLLVAQFLTFVGLMTPAVVGLAVLFSQHPEFPRETSLAWCLFYGAISAMLFNPVMGYLSDRLKLTFEIWGRSLVFAFGLVIALSGNLLLVHSTTLTMIYLGWALCQIGWNGGVVCISASIADHFSHALRGRAASLLGIGQYLSFIVAGIIAAHLSKNIWCLIFIPYVIGVAGFVAFVCLTYLNGSTLREQIIEPSAEIVTAKEHWNRGAIGQLANLWVGMFLVSFANFCFINFQLYFYQKRFFPVLSDAAKLLERASIVDISFLMVAGVVSGYLATTTARHKYLIVGSALLTSFSFLIFSFVHTTELLFALLVIHGLGRGGYAAISHALAVDVIPKGMPLAFILGILNMSGTMAQLAVPVASTFFYETAYGSLNYQRWFIISSVAALFASGFFLRIKKT